MTTAQDADAMTSVPSDTHPGTAQSINAKNVTTNLRSMTICTAITLVGDGRTQLTKTNEREDNKHGEDF